MIKIHRYFQRFNSLFNSNLSTPFLTSNYQEQTNQFDETFISKSWSFDLSEIVQASIVVDGVWRWDFCLKSRKSGSNFWLNLWDFFERFPIFVLFYSFQKSHLKLQLSIKNQQIFLSRLCFQFCCFCWNFSLLCLT